MNPANLVVQYRTLVSKGNFPRAIVCLEQLHQISPDNPEWPFQIAQLHHQLGQTQEALPWYEKALEQAEAPAPILIKLCELPEVQADSQKEIDYLKRLVYIAPEHTKQWLRLCQLYVLLDQPEEAGHALIHLYHTYNQQAEKGVQIYKQLECNITEVKILPLLKVLLGYPDFQTVFFYRQHIKFCLAHQQLEEALTWGDTAYAQTKNPWFLVTCLIDFSDFIWKSDSLQPFRERLIIALETRVSRLSQAQFEQLRQTKPLPFSALFYGAFQGLNDRPLLEAIGKLFTQIFQPSIQQYQCSRLKSPGTPIRIGVVSQYFYGHSVSRVYLQHLKTLAESPDFELICLGFQPRRHDGLAADIRKLGTYIELENDLDASLKLIANQDLDILLYTEIGMSQQTYLLALHRLAPLQYLLAGHPVTSGLPEMDYYVSSRWLEPEDLNQAQSYYSETLIALDYLAINYPKPQFPSTFFDRGSLGLNIFGTVYLCPVPLFKIHPDFDRILKAILEKDRQAHVYFFYYPSSRKLKFINRLEPQLGALIERVHLLPWQRAERFKQILIQTDVILDPIHFGLNSTALIAFARGIPMVTWPMSFMRSRCVAGLYHLMGIEDAPIASSQQEYIELALKLAHNMDYRQSLKNQILMNNHRIYAQQDGVEALLEHMKTAARALPVGQEGNGQA